MPIQYIDNKIRGIPQINQSTPVFTEYYVNNGIGGLPGIMQVGEVLTFRTDTSTVWPTLNLGALTSGWLESGNYFSTNITSGTERFRTIMVLRPNGGTLTTGIELRDNSRYNDASSLFRVSIDPVAGACIFNGTRNSPSAAIPEMTWNLDGNLSQTNPATLATLSGAGNLCVNTGDQFLQKLQVRAVARADQPADPSQAAVASTIPGEADATFRDVVIFQRRSSFGLIGVGAVRINNAVVSVAALSDYRRKKDIREFDNALQDIQRLQPVAFNWRNDLSSPKSLGFLAHEMASVVPQAVSGTKDEVDDDGHPVYQMADYGYLIPLITAATQQLHRDLRSLTQSFSAQG